MSRPQISLKRSILFLPIFLLSIWKSVYGQEMPPILKTTEYQPGIYLNYLEFLTNSPSIKQGFTIKKRDPLVLLDIQDKSLKKQAKNFWGASDGKSVYISSSDVVKGAYNVKPYQLSLLTEINRYCLFTVEHYNTGGYDSPFTGPITKLYSSIPFVMNINNGISFPLKKENVKRIIGDDNELLSEYEDARRKNSIWVKSEYIVDYNKTHQHEINFSKSAAKVVVFRRAKKDNAEEVVIKKADGSETRLSPNSKLIYQSLEPTMSLCANNNCAAFILSNDSVTYIQCTATDKSVTLNKVSLEEGIFYTREVDYYSKKASEAKNK